MPADYQLWIDGAPTDAASGETFETLDPSTGQAHATVARAGPGDVERAVAAARAAFEDGRWSGLKPERRAAVLQAVAAKLKEQAARLEQIGGEKRDIAFGSQIRSYVLHPYQMVKDHRTGVETGNIQAVLDGDLDQFVAAELRRRASTGA